MVSILYMADIENQAIYKQFFSASQLGDLWNSQLLRDEAEREDGQVFDLVKAVPDPTPQDLRVSLFGFAAFSLVLGL
jgi:hypothetical protein